MPFKLDSRDKARHCDRLLNILNENQEAKDILLGHVLSKLRKLQKNIDSKSSDGIIKQLNKLFPEKQFNERKMNTTRASMSQTDGDTMKENSDDMSDDSQVWEII